MIEDYRYFGAMLAASALGINLLKPASKTPKQDKLLARLDEAERVYLKRLSSPEVKLADAKRERKRQKLLKANK